MQFRQKEMRTHLAECFRKKQLEPFPFVTSPAPHVKSQVQATTFMYIVTVNCQKFMTTWFSVTIATSATRLRLGRGGVNLQ